MYTYINSIINQLNIIDILDIQYLNKINYNSSNWMKRKANKPKCMKGNEAVSVCISKQCEKNPFICSNCHQEGGCLLSHKQCVINGWEKYVEGISHQSNSNKKQIQEILKNFKTFFKNSQEDIKKSYSEFQEWSNKYDENNNTIQDEFMQIVKDKKFEKISKKMILDLNDGIDQIKLKQKKSKIQCEIKQISKHLKEIPKKIKNIFQGETPVVLLDSKLTEDVDYLISLFRPSQVSKFTLLYRASEQQFSAQKFHELCDNIPHLLVIAITQYDKIVGGYTPIPFKKSFNNDYQADESKKCFLFSLTLKQKLKLIQSQKSIFYGENEGPAFGGGHDLKIGDKANQISSSMAYYPWSYKFPNGSSKKTQQGYTKFTGQPNDVFFKVNQWEVFQVDFQK